jgi:hypothetical protein
MVKKLKTKIKRVEVFFIILIFIIFSMVIGKYFFKFAKEQYIEFKEYRRQQLIENLRKAYICPSELQTIYVAGGKVCRPDVPDSNYKKIFDTYSYKSNGKEQVYKFLSEGDIESANLMLEDNILHTNPLKYLILFHGQKILITINTGGFYSMVLGQFNTYFLHTT